MSPTQTMLALLVELLSAPIAAASAAETTIPHNPGGSTVMMK